MAIGIATILRRVQDSARARSHVHRDGHGQFEPDGDHQPGHGEKYWPNDDPIGQVIVIGKGLGPQFEDPPRQVVGVVGNVRENGLAKDNVGVMYIPQSQMPEGMTALANSVIPLSWTIRTRTDPL